MNGSGSHHLAQTRLAGGVPLKVKLQPLERTCEKRIENLAEADRQKLRRRLFRSPFSSFLLNAAEATEPVTEVDGNRRSRSGRVGVLSRTSRKSGLAQARMLEATRIRT